jgi:diacylglycerol kinase
MQSESDIIIYNLGSETTNGYFYLARQSPRKNSGSNDTFLGRKRGRGMSIQSTTQGTPITKLTLRSFSLQDRFLSFRYAINGILLMLKSQHNAWIHAAASVLVLLFGAFFRLSSGQWCWLVVAIMAVWTAEALNTALELLADVASSEFHPLVEKAKDVAAGAVLISAVGSVVIAMLILGPNILTYLRLVRW